MAEDDDRFVICPGCRKPSVLSSGPSVPDEESEPETIGRRQQDDAAAASGPADAAGEVALPGVH